VTCFVRGTGICGHTSFNSIVLDVSTVNVKQASGGLADIRLTPNPNNGTFNLKGLINGLDASSIDVEVTDMLGQIIYTNTLPVHAGGIDEYIKLSNNLANGMYMLRINASDSSKTFRFVVGR